ncbi:MAG: riboflavin synthase [Chloroflexota bacterium]
MFTGIVEEVGKVRSLKGGAEPSLTIEAKAILEDVHLGDSIAVNGVCLTVTAFEGSSFTVGLMPETLRRSNLGNLGPAAEINLERALAVGGRLGGHFVQGHVDGTGRLLEVRRDREALVVRFSAPPEVMRYIVPKGFVAVDGISLTVLDCDRASFAVSLVNFTQQHVTLANRRAGYVVNLECDILGKYVERFVKPGNGGLTAEFLAAHGFAGSLGREE